MNRTTRPLGLLLLGVALTAPLHADPVASQHGSLPEGLHHLIAWVPRHQAPTTGVAQALVHLQLDQALRTAEAELCNGAWQLSPPRSGKSHPIAATAPSPLGAGPAWYYRLSQGTFTLEACPGVNTAEFQRTVSRHLPAWMLIQPAYQLSLWQQGEAIASDPYVPASSYRVAGL
jgi:hypothetical protein